jgi:hypothetical protein
VTYIHLLDHTVMENHPWQTRARKSGLSQKVLAQILGHAEITVSRQLRGHWESGVPLHVCAAIVAWELMTEDQRQEWIAEVGREKRRRKRLKAKPGAK